MDEFLSSLIFCRSRLNGLIWRVVTYMMYVFISVVTGRGVMSERYTSPGRVNVSDTEGVKKEGSRPIILSWSVNDNSSYTGM